MNRNMRSRSSRRSGGMHHAAPRNRRAQSQGSTPSPPGSHVKTLSRRYSFLFPGRLYRRGSSAGGICPRTALFQRVCWWTPRCKASSTVPMADHVGRLLMTQTLVKNSSAVGKSARRGMMILDWQHRGGAAWYTLTNHYHDGRLFPSIGGDRLPRTTNWPPVSSTAGSSRRSVSSRGRETGTGVTAVTGAGGRPFVEGQLSDQGFQEGFQGGAGQF